MIEFNIGPEKLWNAIIESNIGLEKLWNAIIESNIGLEKVADVSLNCLAPLNFFYLKMLLKVEKINC